ncbi:MAG: TM2 domain-containing protein, partial [Chloroflexota bacterium]|nr:TM2 domain-containing protein [Chloroflexota bacterium]
MSVDISQLAARLDPERREAIKAQYEERETNPTAAFLLCFFLGSAGAHRFYLKE